MNYTSPEVQIVAELKQSSTTSSLSIKTTCSIILVSEHVSYTWLTFFFFFFLLRINGRILFNEIINLYKNKAASKRAKVNCTSYIAFPPPIKNSNNMQGYIKESQRKTRLSYKLKTSFHN